MAQINQFQQDKTLRLKSREIFEKLCQVIPGGVNSPVRASSLLEGAPLVAESAFEDQVIDADGYSYIDYCGSWGALILGHAHPKVVAAAVNQVQLGSSFGMATASEQEIAAEIIRHFPSIEKISREELGISWL